MPQKITFLLPFNGKSPVGGYKVVYEYANKLAKDNYIVNIIYPSVLFFNELPYKEKILSIFRFIYRRIFRGYSCKKWFKLNSQIKELYIFSLNQKYIPNSDIFVATAWQTAEYLASYKNINKSLKFYLIQHYENYYNNEARLLDTWKAPLQKIVIAPWLQKIAKNLNEDAHLIENGFDFDYFKLSIPIENKDPYCLCMLYHTLEWKGTNDGIEAIIKVKEKYPQLKVNLFGVPPKGKNMPNWIKYYQKPNQHTHNLLYNEASIFLGSSHAEGFCLTPPEAMQCGCAVVCTDIGGYTVVCKHEETALLSPTHDPDALAQNIIRLIEDNNLRIKIAKNGYNLIQRYTWDRSYELFKKLITEFSH